MAVDNYGIAGQGSNKSTTPNLPPAIRLTTPPSLSEQMAERRLKYGSVNVGGSYLNPLPGGAGWTATQNRGTPMRPLPSQAKIPYFGGTATNRAGYTPPIGDPSVYESGTPTNPAGYIPRAPRTGPLVYQTGTPTNLEGYIPYPDYFDGTPTSTVGYDPDAPPQSEREKKLIQDAENARKKREQEAAAAEAAEAARLAGLREIYNTLGAVTPEQQMAYRQSIRSAERDYELMLNQIRSTRRGARRNYRQDVRGVNRQQAGGSQDLASALAYLGIDTSPAALGVGLQDVEMQADVARSGLAATKAEQLAAADAQLTQALIERNRQRSAAEQARLQARTDAALRAQNFLMENPELM